MQPVNQIAVVTDGLKYRKRNLKGVSSLVIHRCGVGNSARDTHLAYRDTTEFAPGFYTGGKFPYHFLLLTDGTVEQCLPLTYRAPAALPALNETGIHLALIGDFRSKPVTPKQASSLLALCEALQEPFNWELEVVGHTEKPGSSDDPNKSCPGKHLNLDGLRDSLRKSSVRYLDPQYALVEQGFFL